MTAAAEFRDVEISDIKALQRCADAEIGGAAWPTIALSTAAIAGFTGAVVGAATGITPYWLAGLINIFCFFIAYTGLHEATHRNFHGRAQSLRWLNHVFGVILGGMMLYPLSMHDYLHLRHHAHTNDPEKDVDCWMSGAAAQEVAFRAMTLPWAYWSYTIRTKIKEPDSGQFFRRLALELSPAILAMSALIATGNWQVALFVWFGPLLIAVALLGVCFDWIVHHPHEKRTLLGATRVLTARPGWRHAALNAFLLGQNYHLIHHIFPRTPFYRYQAVFRRSETFLRAQNVKIIDL